MNTYDQISFTDKPLFYLSSPTLTDQSGASTWGLTNNGVTAIGQAIIFGHKNSFYITDTNYFSITGSLGFGVPGNTIEMVLYSQRPTQEYAAFADDTTKSGIYLNESSISVRVFSSQGLDTEIRHDVRTWPQKFYLRLSFTYNEITFSVNGETSSATYTTLPTVTTCRIGYGMNDEWFLIDGLGVYSGQTTTKSNHINDANNGYFNYVRHKQGKTITFSEATSTFTKEITNKDFILSANGLQRSFSYVITPTDVAEAFFTVTPGRQDIDFFASTDVDAVPAVFHNPIAIPNDSLMYFYLQQGFFMDNTDFTMTLKGVLDGKIYGQHSILELTGVCIDVPPNDSIVNCPDSMVLGGYYSGEYRMDTPATLEFVFKVGSMENDNVIYEDADCAVSAGPTGAITGFTSAYLNGDLVTDINDILPEQWYHMVLISPSNETEYVLNYDGVDFNTVAYMFFTVYESTLTATDAQNSFDILVGTDIISVEDNLGTLEETPITGGFEPDNGTSYILYSYPWAVVGAG